MVDRPRALTRTVVIDGEAYGPGDVPPAHVAARIRNPQCWETLEEGLARVGLPIRGSEPELAPANPGTVPIPDPVTGGLRNLEPQNPGTPSSQVPLPVPGTISGIPAAEVPVDQAEFVAPADHASQPAGPGPGPLPEPPRSGRGATTLAWKAYAEQFEVQVPVGADRSEIVALLKVLGHIQ